MGKESRKKTPGVWRDFDHSKYETYVVEAKNTYHVDEHHTVTYGGEYRKQKAGGTRLGTGAGKRTEETYLGMTKPYGSADVKSYAFYVQDEWNLTDILFLSRPFAMTITTALAGNFLRGRALPMP